MFKKNEYLSKIRELEKEISELRTKLEKSEETNRLKTVYMNKLGHDLRRPMSGILGFTELMARPDLPVEKARHFAGIIHDSAGQMMNKISEIMSISRIERGIIKLHHDFVNLNDILFEIRELFSARAEENGLVFITRPGLDDKQAIIKTDRVRLKDILKNLVENSMKYTSEGHVKIGYYLEDDEENPMIHFFVEDTGIGIDDLEQGSIFEPFRQVDNVVNQEIEGAGLGLSVVNKLVEMLGGEVSLKSEPKKGSVFGFSIPYDHTQMPETGSSDLEQTDLGLIPVRVLVVDDELTNFVLIQEILTHTGLDLIHAPDGLEAIKMIREDNNIRLVLMDLRMPGMDGYEATRRIKQIRPDLGVVIQTAHAQEEVERKLEEIGCDGFITKPIDVEILMSYVRKLALDT